MRKNAKGGQMLTILLITLLMSVVIGLVAGGKLGNLATLKLRAVYLVYPSLIIGLLPLFVSTSRAWSNTMTFGAYAGVASFLLINLRERRGLVRTGVVVLIAGWLLNALPILANGGGMPLSLDAYRSAGYTEIPTPREGGFYKITIATPETNLNWLGDAIPLAPIRQVVSIGDLLLALGIALVVVGAMRSLKPMPLTESNVR